MSDTDLELLRRYSNDRAEDAFAEIVRRHLDLVYSAALRQVRSPHLAQEVAQSVFTDLACSAHRLAPDTVVAAWLYQVARRTAVDVVRREARRQLREQIAAEMNAMNAPSADWSGIEPLLDEAMNALDATDRAAVLLRYFENQSLREVGLALHTTEDAAQKRVRRALERLRRFFAKRGVTIGASGLGAVLAADAVQSAPAGLATTVTAAATVAGWSVTAATSAAAHMGWSRAFWHAARAKPAVVVTAAALVGVATVLWVRSPARTRQVSGSGDGVLRTGATDAGGNVSAAPSATVPSGDAARPRVPDPRQLLLGVAQARQRILSGSIEFEVWTEHFGPPRHETNQLRVVALFDGPKLRFEQFDRQYSYAYSADENEQADIVKRADGMARPSAVAAGLLKPFESHRTLAHDGDALLDYWETDGKSSGTSIKNPALGSASFIFDPRCLGLRTSLSPGDTVEHCLRYGEAETVELIGEEAVEGTPAWHVQVKSKHDAALDFWISVPNPERVLKHAYGSNVAISRYRETRFGDPIPMEVTTMDFRGTSPVFGKRFVRTQSRYNVSVDPAAFTLAGLGMAVGTAVSDDRISRRIGYWTGTGLSEHLPRRTETEPPPPPNPTGLLAVLDRAPDSVEGFDAAAWILRNNPDGSEVEKAAEAILRHHSRDTNLMTLCSELERLRHRCSKPLLEAILKNNPSADVRGTACLALATLFKDEAKYGRDGPATAAAERYYERATTEFGQVQRQGWKLEDLARPELQELRHLFIGRPAPETAGADLEGQLLRLSDYRGQVVVLVFWSWQFPEAGEFRKLREEMSGKPFALLGVNGDRDLERAKATAEEYKVNWPSFQDGRDGPIAKRWNSRRWPDIWVLDRQGVIRYRDVRGNELRDAVTNLLGE